MPGLKLLILDATEVIHLHEMDIRAPLIEKCEVFLARTVVEKEVVYFRKNGEEVPINLDEDLAQKRVRVFDISIPGVKRFLDLFDPVYVSGLDPGETESLAFLTQSAEAFLISSGDAIVYRILGLLNRGDQGISLEEVLNKIGLQRANLPNTCKKAFRERFSRDGRQYAIRGRGLRR